MLRYFSTIRKDIIFLTLLSTILLFIKITWLNSIPSLFVGGKEIGLIVEAVLYSFIASFVFYFLVVHIKEQRDIQKVKPHVKRWASRIVFDCELQIKCIASAAKCDLDYENPNLEKLKSALEKIDPSSEPPARLYTEKSKEDWLEMMATCAYDIDNVFQYIIQQSIYIDSGLLSHVIELIETSHHKYIKIESIKGRAKNLSSKSQAIYDYWTKSNELKKYIEKM